MSSSSSDSENSQNDSEYNFFTGNVFEVEEGASGVENLSDDNIDNTRANVPYADEPLADEGWLVEYNKQMVVNEEREREFSRRLEGSEPVEAWCKCGHCRIELLQCTKECYCCTEIDGCMEALNDTLVLQDVSEVPPCVTLHPGFAVVCLEKWSLRQAARKHKTRDQRKYKQTGTETEFLRLVAYREFTYLIHGYLGNKRIPLPACTYHSIRSTFKVGKEEFTGFREDNE